MDFRADFAEDKAKFRRLAAASQEILTQSSAKFAEKMHANFYENKFLPFLTLNRCSMLKSVFAKRPRIL